jgi:hypothetical protein
MFHQNVVLEHLSGDNSKRQCNANGKPIRQETNDDTDASSDHLRDVQEVGVRRAQPNCPQEQQSGTHTSSDDANENHKSVDFFLHIRSGR